VVDPISPDGRIVRVHLRPYLAAGGDTDGLLAAFVRTAQEYHGTLEQLQRFWNYAVALAAAGQFPLSADPLTTFWEQMGAQGYAAVHHSAGYGRTYHPAYRVVLRELLPGFHVE
jgi:hypothetical protein